MNGFLRQQVVAWGMILGLWALLVATFAGQLVFTAGFQWGDALLMSLRDWYPWLILGPIVAWLAWRYPFEKNELVLSIPVHLAACMLAVLACELLARPFPAPQPAFPGGPPPLRNRWGAEGPREGSVQPGRRVCRQVPGR